MLLDFLTLIIIGFFIVSIVINRKLILSKQSYINNTFFFVSAIYFYISHYYFNDVISLSEDEKSKYEVSRHVAEDKRERNFMRFIKALSRRANSFVIEIVLFIYFLFIIFFITVKTETARGQLNLSPIFSRTKEDVSRFTQTFLISYIFSYVTFYLVKNLFYIKTFTNLVLNVMNITLFFVIIGTAYRYVYKNFYKIVGKDKKNIDFMNRVNVFFALIESVIFYIPCLIDDLFSEFTKTRNNTTRKMLMIFAIQILIIFYYFIVPTVNRTVSKYLGNIILDTPLNLDSNYNKNDVILTKIQLRDVIAEEGYKVNGTSVLVDENYGISFWLYLDSQQDIEDKDFTVLDFSNRPKVLFNTLTKQLKFKFYNDRDIVLENVPFQRWNHVVVNYLSGTVDVLINNELVESVENIRIENTVDDVRVGEINGIPGRITNIAFFSEPLDGSLIGHIYKSSNNSSIPKNSGVLGNSLFLIQKTGRTFGSAIDGVDGIAYGAVNVSKINEYIPDVKTIPKRSYNALTNFKENVQEYYQYFIDYYVFDYHFDFKKIFSQEDALATEKMETEKEITKINKRINRLTLEKTSRNVEMVSNGEDNDAIYRMNKEYQDDIDKNKDTLQLLNKRLKINEDKQKTVL